MYLHKGAGDDGSAAGQRFFRPMVHFCHRGVCTAVRPGFNSRIPGYKDLPDATGEMKVRYRTPTEEFLYQSAPDYCGSAYFDAETQELCGCVSQTCYDTTWATHSTRLCKHKACSPLLLPGTRGFCNFLPWNGRIKFVPISFADQDYFHPGIRVVSDKRRSGSTAPLARNLYLDFEHRETEREFMVDLGGNMYKIHVERKPGDLICAAHKEGDTVVRTGCVPTPALPHKPSVHRIPRKSGVIRVTFPGCKRPSNCTFDLRMGEEKQFPANMYAFVPSVTEDHMFDQYAICPDGPVSEPEKVAKMRAGQLLCPGNHTPELRYKLGDTSSSNLRCLAINQPFFPTTVVSRRIVISSVSLSQFQGKDIQSNSGVNTACAGCTKHFEYNRSMVRDARGRINIDKYAELAFSQSKVHTSVVVDVATWKNFKQQDMGERKLVSNVCPGLPHIPLSSKQELLDLLAPDSQGAIYLSRQDISAWGIRADADLQCSDYNIPLRYSEPVHGYYAVAYSGSPEFIGDPYDQGLCVLVSKKRRIQATDTVFSEGAQVSRNPKGVPKYEYVKYGILKGCKFVRADLFEAGTTGVRTTHLVKNRNPEAGLTGIFSLGSSAIRRKTVLILCAGTVPVKTLGDQKGYDCAMFEAGYSGVFMNPQFLNLVHRSGQGALESVYSVYGTRDHAHGTTALPYSRILLTCID
ncbi:MAG: hypothetical protein ACTJLK_00020 [Anaplasma sp.]